MNSVADPQFVIHWYDAGREPEHPPNPDFPNGRDVLMGHPKDHHCKVDLPYPAKRCGHYIVYCNVCGLSTGITTAGRPDDPRSITIPCKNVLGSKEKPN